MLYRLINYLQDKESFWKAGLFFNREINFRLNRRLFSIRHRYREEKISSVILRHSLRKIITTALRAAIFIFVVELLSKQADKVSFTLGDDELGLLLSTIVTVTGVFLGLYFTALSSVAGNLFMRAPTNLQNLFLRDRKGGQYIQTLVLTTLIGIFYLLLRAFGYQVGFLGPVLITILALYAVVRFMALGGQTFYFIHPSEASSVLTGDIATAIDNAAFSGFGSNKDYLQKHYRRQAREAIETLNDLVSFGIKPVKLSSKQMLEIARYCGSVLDYYLEKKKQIPTESLWFARKYENQKWLITDESAITMAINTGTSLQPKEVRNELWFEEAVIDVILRIFEHIASQKEWGHAQAVLEVIVSTIEACGGNFYDETVKLAITKSEQSINKVLSNEENISDKDNDGHLALLDSLGRMPIGALVSLMRYVNDRDVDSLIKELDKIKWSKKKSIYNTTLPGKLLFELERTQRRYANELEIEGKPISPQWYLRTIAMQQYLRHLEKYYRLIKTYNNDVFVERSNALIGQKKYLQAAHVIDRWLEFTNKLLSLSWKVQKIVDDSKSLHMVHDLPWTEMDGEKEKEELQGFNMQAIDKLTTLIAPLSFLSESEIKDLPDYFGQAYTFGVEAAYNAALENNTERLKELFPHVFIGALQAKDKVRKDVEGWAEQSQILLTSEPIEDLLTLSGFIKIYSELYENEELWNICKNAWGKYLENTDAQAVINMMVAMCLYRDGRMGVIMHKAGIRINWDQRLRHKLGELGFDVDLFSSRTPFDDEEGPSHNSPLIRTVIRHSGLLSFDTRNIFFVVYLSKHPAAEGVQLEFPDRRDFEERLNREMGIDEDAE